MSGPISHGVRFLLLTSVRISLKYLLLGLLDNFEWQGLPHTAVVDIEAYPVLEGLMGTLPDLA